MKLVRSLAALAFVTLSVTVVSAQTAGGLKIRVIDNADKSEVIGAAVTVSNTNKLVATATIITDVKGIALFPVLRAGPGYVVQVIMDGYAGIRQEVSVTNGNTKDVVIALAPEHVEKVTVTAEKTSVDLDKNQTATKFSSEFIADLPIQGNFYQNVLTLAPGVQDPDGDGNPNVNGARERDFKTQVSGISNVDPLTGTFLNLVTSDSIEDLTVITAGAGAEFGRAQGGFAQIIQKQGSNKFEGLFGMIYSSKLLDGTGSTGNPSSLQPDFYNYQPSLQVSGPIVQDKLWYRLTQEVIMREDPVILSTGGETQGTKRFSTDDQITWQVSNRNKLAFNFRADPLTQTNVGISTLTPASSSEKQQSGGPTYTLTWTAPYSPTLLVDSTVAYQDTHIKLTPTESNVQNNCYGTSTYLKDAQCFNTGNGAVTGSSPRVWQDARQRLTVKSDATYYKGRMWGAVHQFKFGLAIENERYFRTLEQDPTFFLTTGAAVRGQPPGINFFITASLSPFSQQRAVANAVGMYGEDVIRPIPNLSVTLGLRVEQENVNGPGYKPFDPQAESNQFLHDIQGLTFDQVQTGVLPHAFIKYEDQLGATAAVATQFPGLTLNNSPYNDQLTFWKLYRQGEDINIHNTNIAPRLSVSWDPWNDGKTKFAVSAGRYYDKIFLAVLTQESTPVAAQFRVEQGHFSVPFDPTYSFTTIDRNLKTPYNDEFTISAQRTFLEENSVSLTYVHRNFQKELERHNINQVPGDYGRCVIAQSSTQPAYVPSPGTGPLVDPYTGLTYQDTDPGNGDGRLDDCTGKTLKAADGSTIGRPDGAADFYVLNPAWGDIRQLGNNNTAYYQGLTLEFVRRQYKNWQMEASYTLSEAIGDSEDFSLLLGNDRSTLSQERGFLAFDKTHALKVNATCITPWGFRLGGAVGWASGLPYSLVTRNVSASDQLPSYVIGGQEAVPGKEFTSTRTSYPTQHRNDQRNGSAWNFDVNLVKDVSLPKGMNLQLQAKIFNLFGEDTYVIYDSFTKVGEQINGTNDATRRFGRQYEIGMRLSF